MRQLDRRSLLTSLLALTGAALLGSAPVAEAAARPAAFYETEVSAPGLGAYNVWIARDGSKAYGLATSVTGDHPPVRMEGRVRGTMMKLDLLIPHEGKEQQIGTAQLRTRGDTLLGTISSPVLGNSTLPLLAERVTADSAGIRSVAGSYTASAGKVGIKVDLDANRSFQLTGSYSGIPVGKIQGAWLLDPEGALWLLPRKASESNPFATLKIHVRAPVKLRAEQSGNRLFVYGPSGEELLVVLQRR